MSVNKVILVGHLGKDPELRKTANTQTSVCSFTLATNERRKDQSGQWIDQTEWHRIAAFGNVAENCARFLKKGRQVYVEGKISTRKWTDQEGKDRYTTEVLANTVQFLGGRGEQGGMSLESQGDFSSQVVGGDFGSFAAPADSFAPQTGGVTFDDDDIPF